MTCCGPATLYGRRVWIVELDAAELYRADVFAHRLFRRGRRYNQDAEDIRQGREREAAVDLEHKQLGAQAEIVVGKALDVRAPLDIDSFQRKPDIPPCWSVKAQLSSTKHMLDHYMQIRAGSFHPGWRHVLVERDVALRGSYVFIVHGWISDEQARECSVERFAASRNRFVHLRHLQPLTRELYDTTHGAPTDEPPAPAPFDTDTDAAEIHRQLTFNQQEGQQ